MVNSYAAPERKTIRIDGHTYRTNGSVQQFLLSRQPGKVTIGDFTDASNPMASEFSVGDFRDGIGVERGDFTDDVKRVWYGTGQIRYRDSYVLPRLPVQTGAGPSLNISTLTIFKGRLYATYTTEVHVYDGTNDNWGSSLRTLADDATSTAVGILYPGGTATETLVIANGTDVDYATDISAWAENTGQPIKHVIFWGDLLWGVTEAGAVYYTDDLSAGWTYDSQIPLPAESVTGLQALLGADRASHIHAVTDQGLWIHDSNAARWLPTDLQLPQHIQGGLGHVVWRGTLFSSAGDSIYAYQAGADSTQVTVVGPDLDGGLPQSKRGSITQLLSSHNELLATTDASAGGGTVSLTTKITSGFGKHHSATPFAGATGKSIILGWNERGWEVKWEASDAEAGITASVVGTETSSGNNYRLFWATNKRVYYMALPVDVLNPLNIESQKFDSGAVMETPWFDMGIRNQQKLALSVIVDSKHPTTSETVKIEYAKNLDETFTEVVTKTESGASEYRIPDPSNDGVPFRQWKWKITLARGATNTNTPQLVRLTLVWRPRIETLWGVSASLDLTEDVAGVPPVQQLRNLKDSLNKGTLVDVTFRDDKSGDQRYMMDWLSLDSTEEGGEVTYANVRVSLGEPIASHSDFAHER